MGRGKYDRYSEEFQERAMALGEEIGRAQAARRLGITRDVLQSWIWRKNNGKRMKKNDTPEGRAAFLAQLEIKRLKRENEELKMANLILREVPAIFTKDLLNSSLGRSLNFTKKRSQK